MQVFLRKHWRKVALAGLGLPVIGFLALCITIGVGVRDTVSQAQSRFGGDPVPALIAVATSEETPLPDRNRAIWALGQLGAGEALPTLQNLLTGEPCHHEDTPCQKELKTAIEACSGSTNIGAVVWRHGDLALAGRN